ncbi:MAG: hypothetical protein DWQ46_16565 [Planctomycetota bacterium]|nr:MAG: hypothetical protein DWQ46_16565 [Planctomycetota bacterium]
MHSPSIFRRTPRDRSPGIWAPLVLSALLFGASLGAQEVAPFAEGEDEDRGSPAELLDVLDLTEEKFAALRDGEPLEQQPEGLDLLHRLLFRLPNISSISLDAWAATDAKVSSWPADTAAWRRQFFALEGRIKSFRRVKLATAEALRWNFARYYRCQVMLGEAETPAVVFARAVPRRWRAETPLDEPISFRGLFLVRGAAAEPETLGPLLFACDRLAWHPDSLLGNAGMDVGLLDTVQSGRKLGSADRDCFYALLTAAGTIPQTDLNAAADESVAQRRDELTEKLVELETRQREIEERLAAHERLADAEASAPADPEVQKLRTELANVRRDRIVAETALATTERGFHDLLRSLIRPSSTQGELLRFRGRALRILRVPLGGGDRDVVLRHGFDHYYEIDATVSLDLDVRFERATVVPPAEEQGGQEPGDAASDQQAGGDGDSASDSDDNDDRADQPNQTITSTVETVSQYPVTFCVRTLPEGTPTGPKVDVPIEIVGFHMKNWRFQTGERLADGSFRKRQAPLLIGRKPLIIDTSIRENTTLAIVGGSLFVLTILVVWISVWMLGRGDRAFQEAALSKRYAVDEGVSLNDLDIQTDDGPNFRDLGS